MNPYYILRPKQAGHTNVKLTLKDPDTRIYNKWLSVTEIAELSLKFEPGNCDEKEGVLIEAKLVFIDFKDVNYNNELDEKLTILFELKRDNAVHLQKILSLKGDDYWINNGNNNISLLFKNRSFKHYFNNYVKTDAFKDIIDKTEYLGQFYAKRKYINEQSLKSSLDCRNHFPVLSNKLNRLFDKWNKLNYVKMMSYLFYYLVTTWHYGDTVMKSPHIMTIMKPILEKNYEITGYALTYYFYVMYKLECYLEQNLSVTDRCIFTLNEARLFPVLPVEYYHPETSPFFPLSVNRKFFGKTNLFGYCKTSLYQLGFNSPEECYKDFCLFTSANQNRDITKNTSIFEGINLKGDLAVFCGSLVTFIIPKDSPLTYPHQENKKYHLLEKYSGSDIDMMVSVKTYSELIEYCNSEVIPVISRNLIKHNPDFKELQVTQMYRITYIINDVFLNNNFSPDLHDYIKQNKNKIVRRWIYYILKKETVKLPELYKKIDMVNIKYNYKKQDNEFNICESYKIHIMSNFMTRKVELFMMPKKAHIGNVDKFHMPTVRAYYNMKTAYLTPSFMFAILCNCNLDMKYFFSINNPLAIIMKQHNRGFGTMVNATEKKYLHKYNGKDFTGYNEYDVNISPLQYIEKSDLYWLNVAKLKASILFPVDKHGNLAHLEPALLSLGHLVKKI